MPSLYTRVARRAEANEMPITEAGVAEIDRWLKEERDRELAAEREYLAGGEMPSPKPRRLGGGKDAGAANRGADANATGTGRHDGGGS